MAGNDGGPKFDMRFPFWALLIACATAGAAYFAQREATSIALTEIRSDMTAMKESMKRIETDRYTASDARRDLAWRDERSVEQGRRITDLEADARRRR